MSAEPVSKKITRF